MTLLAVLALMAPPAPIAPPLPQGSADCAHPVYATDQLLCSDPDLRALDREIADLLNRQSEEPAGEWIEDQWSWFRRSRLCAFREDQPACVTAAYTERNTVLTALAKSLPAREGCYTSNSDPQVVTLVVAGKIAAVALPSRPAWQPFVAIDITRSGYVLRDLAGKAVFRCATGAKANG